MVASGLTGGDFCVEQMNSASTDHKSVLGVPLDDRISQYISSCAGVLSLVKLLHSSRADDTPYCLLLFTGSATMASMDDRRNAYEEKRTHDAGRDNCHPRICLFGRSSMITSGMWFPVSPRSRNDGYGIKYLVHSALGISESICGGLPIPVAMLIFKLSEGRASYVSAPILR